MSRFTGDEEFLNHVLSVMARVSIGDFSVRVKIPKNMDPDCIGYRLSAGLNVLISDLENQQRNRVRKLAELAIAKSEEVQLAITQTQRLVEELRNKKRNHKRP